MRKQYITRDSDHKTAYNDLCHLVEDSHRAGVEMLNGLRSHTRQLDYSLNVLAVKKVDVDAIKTAIQNFRRLQQALEISQSRFESKVDTAIKRYDKVFIVRIKTADGYIRSDVSESKIRAARRLKIRKLQKDALKSFNTNSPAVYAAKYGIAHNLGKLLLDNTKKLEQVTKLYNTMALAMANYRKFLNDKLDKARSMLSSIDAREYSKLRDDMDNLVTVAKLIDMCFDKISDTLANVKGTLESNAHSLQETYVASSNGNSWRES